MNNPNPASKFRCVKSVLIIQCRLPKRRIKTPEGYYLPRCSSRTDTASHHAQVVPSARSRRIPIWRPRKIRVKGKIYILHHCTLVTNYVQRRVTCTVQLVPAFYYILGPIPRTMMVTYHTQVTYNARIFQRDVQARSAHKDASRTP